MDVSLLLAGSNAVTYASTPVASAYPTGNGDALIWRDLKGCATFGPSVPDRIECDVVAGGRETLSRPRRMCLSRRTKALRHVVIRGGASGHDTRASLAPTVCAVLSPRSASSPHVCRRNAAPRAAFGLGTPGTLQATTGTDETHTPASSAMLFLCRRGFGAMWLGRPYDARGVRTRQSRLTLKHGWQAGSAGAQRGNSAMSPFDSPPAGGSPASIPAYQSLSRAPPNCSSVRCVRLRELECSC